MEERTPAPVEVNGTGVHALPEPTIHISRIHVPMTMWIGVSIAIVSAAISIVSVWSNIKGHTETSYVHIDQAESIIGGGIAYKHDVSASVIEFKQRMSEEAKKMRRLLKGISFECKRGRGDTFICKVDIPEDEP